MSAQQTLEKDQILEIRPKTSQDNQGSRKSVSLDPGAVVNRQPTTALSRCSSAPSAESSVPPSRKTLPARGGNAVRPNTPDNSFPQAESVPNRRASAPAWKNPLEWDDPSDDGAVLIDVKRIHGGTLSRRKTLGEIPWVIHTDDGESSKEGSRRGSKDQRQSVTSSVNFERLDPSTAPACLDFLSPVKEGQVAFALQRKLKQQALQAKIKLLLQGNPYLQEVVNPLLLPKTERTITQLMTLRNFMCTTTMFQEVAANPVLQLEICRCMSLEVFNEKQNIIKENEAGDRAFVLLRGSISIRRKAFGPQELARKTAVFSFGDVALKVDAPRNASVSAVENGTLVSCLSRKDYRRILVQSGPRKAALQFYSDYYPQLMTDQQRITLAFITEVKEKLPKGSILTEAGQPGLSVFFVLKGTCNVVWDPNPKESTDGSAGLQLPGRSKDRDHKQQHQEQKTQVSNDADEETAEKTGGDDEEKGSDDEANETSPGSKKRERSGSKSDAFRSDVKEATSTPSWMWQSKNILVTLSSGDFFGMEAAASDKRGNARKEYAQTVVAASECDIIEISVSNFQTVFPKPVQQTFEASLLSMLEVRKKRQQFLENNVPKAVTTWSSQERRVLRSRQSGRARKFTPVKTELKYEEWRRPERDLEMEARLEDDPVVAAAWKEVRLQERTFTMDSSICLQNSPGDLLKPLMGQHLRNRTSMGFSHLAPPQRSAPRPSEIKGIKQGDRKLQRVMLQNVEDKRNIPMQNQNLPDNLLQQMREEKMARPRSTPQL